MQQQQQQEGGKHTAAVAVPAARHSFPSGKGAGPKGEGRLLQKASSPVPCKSDASEWVTDVVVVEPNLTTKVTTFTPVCNVGTWQQQDGLFGSGGSGGRNNNATTAAIQALVGKGFSSPAMVVPRPALPL